MAAACAGRRKQGHPLSSASAVVLTRQDLIQGGIHGSSVLGPLDLPQALPLGSKQGPKPSSTPATRRGHAFMGVLPAPARRTRSSSDQRHPPRMPTPPPKGDALGRNGEPQRFVNVTKTVRTQQVSIGGQAEQRIFESRGPAGFRGPSVRASSPRIQAIPDTGSLELCGFDPRRPPRPPIDLRGGPLGIGPVSVAEGYPLRVVQATPPLLAVSGQAAAVNPHPAASSGSPPPEAQGACELQPEDFSSSEDEISGGEQDSDGFRYRDYRYQEARARAKPEASEPQRRRVKRPTPSKGASAKSAHVENERPVAWGTSEGVDQAWSACEDDSDVLQNNPGRPSLDKQEADQLARVAQVLVRFYGLPGGPEVAIKPRGTILNKVAVVESAWSQRKRTSQLDEPPVIFVRGGRVYDFHGDRGTLTEFEHDLLTRQVEDDAVCRTRRMKQGLMPFPFVALPLKQNTEDQTEDNR